MFSQEISGFVNSNNTGIPFASVYIANSSKGVICNSKGEFTILLNSIHDTLIFSAVGYKNFKIKASDFRKKKLVTLSPSMEELNPVIIGSKNNFGERLVELVVQNRKNNNPQNSDYSANLYTKSTLEKEPIIKGDSIKLSFIEKYSSIKHSSGHWQETKIGIKDLSLKQNSRFMNFEFSPKSPRRQLLNDKNKSDLFYTNISDGNFNFYKKTILVPKLAQTSYISPFGTLHKTSYQFDYLGYHLENQKKIHKIKVVPKRPYESTFSGIALIEDSTWAIVSLEFDMKGSNLHKYKKFKIYQHFVHQENKMVLDEQQFIFYYQNITGKYHGAVFSKFSEYNFESQNLRKKNLVIQSVDSAENRPPEFWENKRSLKLSKKENEFIETSDSIRKIEQSEKYQKFQDHLKNKVSVWDVLLSGIDHFNTPKKYKWRIRPLIEQVRVFGIGGYRHNLGGNYIQTFKNKNKLNLSGTLNYGFRNNDIVADAAISYIYSPKHFAQFSISGGSKYQLLTFYQNLSNIFSRSNFVKNNYLKVGHFFEVINGVFLETNLEYLQRKSLAEIQLSQWSQNLFGSNNTPQNFVDYNEFKIYLALSFVPFQKYEINGRKKIIINGKWPTIHFKWIQGIPDIGNAKINYQQIKFGIEQSIKLSVLGTSKYNSWYGRYLHSNSVEYPNYTFFRGTDPYLFSHPLYTFQLLGKTHNSLESYIRFNIIHHYHGALSKKIPIINRTKLEFVSGAGVLYINDNKLTHSEIFNGIELPFKAGKTKLKLGAYYVNAYSNYSDLSNMFKFGLNVFNPFTNKWAF